MATLDGVQSELATRVQWVIDQAALRGVVIWITTGWRSMPEQQRLWRNWTAALARVGCPPALYRNPPERLREAAQRYAPLAAYPGTSNHGTSPATAVDLAVGKSGEAVRAELIKKAGLHTPVPGEPWHVELADGRGPLPDGRPLPPVAVPDQRQEDELFDAARTIIWPDGSKTCSTLDGDIQCFEAGPNTLPPHYGGMGSFPVEKRRTFTEVAALTPKDPANKGAGYVIWNKKSADGRNDRWDFNQCVLDELQGRK